MTDDRTLLEKAAKAAGILIYWHEETDSPMLANRLGTVPWNPLTNDGDALRLAVKLGFVCGFVQPNCWAELPGEHPAYEPCDPDPYAATRRVIVRAAAALSEKD